LMMVSFAAHALASVVAEMVNLNLLL